MRGRSGFVAVAATALVVGLAGCGAPSGEDESSGESSQIGSTTEGGTVVLPGTGRFRIGTEAPYGGYQLVSEPDELPAGCTWSIVDADGEVQFENQGIYAFLEDVKESVTFITDGCPDWEKFQ